MPHEASRRPVSVRLYVCPSRSCIVSKRIKVSVTLLIGSAHSSKSEPRTVVDSGKLLAYSARRSILIAHVAYRDRDDRAFARLVAVNTRNHQVMGNVGSALYDAGCIAAEFVRDTGMLVVVYSSSAENEGNAPPPRRLCFHCCKLVCLFVSRIVQQLPN